MNQKYDFPNLYWNDEQKSLVQNDHQVTKWSSDRQVQNDIEKNKDNSNQYPHSL